MPLLTPDSGGGQTSEVNYTTLFGSRNWARLSERIEKTMVWLNIPDSNVVRVYMQLISCSIFPQ